MYRKQLYSEHECQGNSPLDRARFFPSGAGRDFGTVHAWHPSHFERPPNRGFDPAFIVAESAPAKAGEENNIGADVKKPARRECRAGVERFCSAQLMDPRVTF